MIASASSLLTDAVEWVCSFSNLPNANIDTEQAAGRILALDLGLDGILQYDFDLETGRIKLDAEHPIISSDSRTRTAGSDSGSVPVAMELRLLA